MASRLVSGQYFGRYRVLEPIGRGGLGSVYKCHDEQLDRFVAVKVLVSPTPDLRERFEREARVIARLVHPQIVQVYDIGIQDDRVFIVQELLDGADLSEILKAGLIPFEVGATILKAVADALAYAHSQDVVHRDIKPSNIRVLPGGIVKLLDFGLAIVTSSGEDLQTTSPGLIVGTPAYMSPELLQGDRADVRSDIYSFGLVAFEVFAGKRPFEGNDLTSLMFRIISEPAPSLVAAVPRRVKQLVAQCLVKNPQERPASMEAIAETFRDVLAHVDLPAVASAWPVPAGGLVRTAPQEHAELQANPTMVTGSVATPFSPSAPSFPIPPVTSTQSWGPEPAPLPPAPPATPYEGAAQAPERDRRKRDVDDDANGKRVGRFTVHERIARGKSGSLYKAYDSVRGCLVGLKLISGDDDETQRRILRGGRIWLKLKHPNLVTVLEVHPDYYGYAGVIVSELVEGIDLTELASRPRLGLEQIISIGVQLCGALTYIHAEGIVHREVRPQNVLVTPALKVILLDSGIARHSNPEIDAFTKTGIVVGDLSYASPEQFSAGRRVDQRVDVYSVAAVLFELVTGARLDFGRRSDPRTALEAVDLPERLRHALARAVDADPAARYTTAQELADALQSVIPESRRPRPLGNVVVTLHGIRTHARWQRTFAEVAGGVGLDPRTDRWWFGYFSSLRFLLPWSRLAKVRWLRETYDAEFRVSLAASDSLERPSIIAHSFGTYILGNALLRYPYLRFGKIVLCGSILPTTFPWDALIERGQVQAVRNEFGSEDLWTRIVDWFIPGTGPSGLLGFKARHPRLEQHAFTFSHSEYFERNHMETQWLPFLKRRMEVRPPQDAAVLLPPSDRQPVGLYALYLAAAIGLVALTRTLMTHWPS